MSANSDQRIQATLDFLMQGVCDMGPHARWYLDQVVRRLCDTDEAYRAFVDRYQGWDAENGCHLYDWEEGIAP